MNKDIALIREAADLLDGTPKQLAKAQELRALADRMEAKPISAAIPDGWKLVPIEPTESMMDAYRYAFTSKDRFDGANVYKAMLTAAPAPQDSQMENI